MIIDLRTTIDVRQEVAWVVANDVAYTRILLKRRRAAVCRRAWPVYQMDNLHRVLEVVRRLEAAGLVSYVRVVGALPRITPAGRVAYIIIHDSIEEEEE